MAWGRRARHRAIGQEQAHVAEPVRPPGVRRDGPFDVSERAGDEPGYIDLGPLRVRVDDGLSLQLPADKKNGEIASVVIVGEEGGLDLRAFAAPKSGGLWDEVIVDLEAEVNRRDGHLEHADGPFGRELRFRVPVTLPSGEPGYQPNRVIGIDGPRWMVRATFLGRAATEPNDDGQLMRALRNLVVVRGDQARLPRESLLLTLPPGAKPAADV